MRGLENCKTQIKIATCICHPAIEGLFFSFNLRDFDEFQGFVRTNNFHHFELFVFQRGLKHNEPFLVYKTSGSQLFQ